MICPTCGSNRSRGARTDKGIRKLFPDNNANRRQCVKCGRIWKLYEKNPKLLYFDIETAPVVAYTWGAHKQYINPDNIIDDWFIMAWAAKWVCTSSMFSHVVSVREVKNCDDSRIIKPLWDLFNEADIIIGHNSDRFDIKRMNWRWAMHDYKPPRPYKTVDTLKAARSVWGATSNKLDFLTKQLGLNGKLETQKGLFHKCKEGDAKALRELRKYNEIDVLEGESLYLKVRPWMKHHPNMGLYYETNQERCKNCGGTDLDYDRNKPVVTTANTYVCWTCVNCGAHGRTPESTRYEAGYPGEDSEDRKARASENRDKRNSLMR